MSAYLGLQVIGQFSLVDSSAEMPGGQEVVNRQPCPDCVAGRRVHPSMRCRASAQEMPYQWSMPDQRTLH